MSIAVLIAGEGACPTGSPGLHGNNGSGCRSCPSNVSALSEARFHKSVKSGRGALRAFDRAV